jgi:hypothetical protein
MLRRRKKRRRRRTMTEKTPLEFLVNEGNPICKIMDDTSITSTCLIFFPGLFFRIPLNMNTRDVGQTLTK